MCNAITKKGTKCLNSQNPYCKIHLFPSQKINYSKISEKYTIYLENNNILKYRIFKNREFGDIYHNNKFIKKFCSFEILNQYFEKIGIDHYHDI